LSTFGDLSVRKARIRRWQNQSTQEKMMKKIFVLTAMFGFVAALNISAADVKANWDSICAKCHGADGKGDTKIGQKLGIKDFTDAKVQDSIKDEDAVKAVKDGIKDADGRTKMKAYVTGADTPLSDDEVKALVAYVRGLKK
jgi:mono/diheme cytochrome c family protein